jgi:hypothetical protein
MAKRDDYLLSPRKVSLPRGLEVAQNPVFAGTALSPRIFVPSNRCGLPIGNEWQRQRDHDRTKCNPADECKPEGPSMLFNPDRHTAQG